MKAPPRQILLGGALVATLAATAWVATRPEENVAMALPVRQAAIAPSGPAAASPPVSSAASTPTPSVRQPWADVEPAQLAAWQPPPPPPPPPAPPPAPLGPPAPPPPPMAPALPYQMIGRVFEGDGPRAVEKALLTGPSQVLSVQRGDVIDGQWRVEQVTVSGVSLTWLPAKLPQNIAFRSVP